MDSTERRRSDRMMLTLPLRARGIDSKGERFEAAARTVVLGRHGAQIQVAHSLLCGQTVRLANLIVGHGADFRVVGQVCSLSEECAHYGVECLDSNQNIWRIQFPPAADGTPPDAKALLECRLCHTVALVSLSLGELEVLRMAGLAAKPCATCNAVAPMRYAEPATCLTSVKENSWMSGGRSAEDDVAGLSFRRRDHRRVCMQLLVGIRDQSCAVEIVQTVNVSRGGFAIASARQYQVGEHVSAIFPYDVTSGQKMELPARIVREARLHGTVRKIYGAHYESLGPTEVSGIGEA